MQDNQQFGTVSTGMKQFAGAQSAPTVAPVLISEVQETQGAIDGLRKTIMGLEERLTPILRPAEPSNAREAGSVPRALASPIVDQLTSQRSDLFELNRRLGSILAHLDL